jgi:hypothetical protein
MVGGGLGGLSRDDVETLMDRTLNGCSSLEITGKRCFSRVDGSFSSPEMPLLLDAGAELSFNTEICYNQYLVGKVQIEPTKMNMLAITGGVVEVQGRFQMSNTWG